MKRLIIFSIVFALMLATAYSQQKSTKDTKAKTTTTKKQAPASKSKAKTTTKKEEPKSKKSSGTKTEKAAKPKKEKKKEVAPSTGELEFFGGADAISTSVRLNL